MCIFWKNLDVLIPKEVLPVILLDLPGLPIYCEIAPYTTVNGTIIIGVIIRIITHSQQSACFYVHHQSSGTGSILLLHYFFHLEGFGMTKPTGLDLPGEADSLIVPEKTAVPYDLAAMSIGQSNAFTACFYVHHQSSGTGSILLLHYFFQFPFYNILNCFIYCQIQIDI